MLLKSTLYRLNSSSENQRDACALAELIYGDSCLELETFRMCKDCYGNSRIHRMLRFISRCK